VAQLTPSTTTSMRRHHRMARWLSGHVGTVIGVVIVVCLAVVMVGAARLDSWSHSGSASSTRPHQSATQTIQPVRYLGVYEPDSPGSYVGVDQFAQAVGRRPNLVGYYSGWGEQFQETFAKTAANHGAVTIVQMDPNVPLPQIAAGNYDLYLSSFADDVAAFKRQVVISFGHEMNGYWYSWGYSHSSPAAFVAAWRHVVTLFRRRGADNVTWLWQVNSLSPRTGPVRDWWPGSQYVTWVGVSGYYFIPGETFRYIFGPVIAAVRRFTQDPVLIAETGVGPFPEQASGIRDLFAGLRAQHDLGLVWFDENKPASRLYKGGSWRLEGNPVALATFRSALAG
jgi:mannan endo-1,4-beta-mannosidase